MAYHRLILSDGAMVAALEGMGHPSPSEKHIQHKLFTQAVNEAVQGLPPVAYLKESTAFHADLNSVAKKCLNVGILAQGERIALIEPMEWSLYATKSRSVRYKVHAWGVLDAMLAYDSLRLDNTMYQPALANILDWISTYVLKESNDEFAWYDMAVGQRATKLAYIFRRAVEQGEPVETLAKLTVACHLHVLELSEAERIAMHSNHGLFQMSGLLALSKSLPHLRFSSTAASFAIDSIQTMLGNHFSSDGLHMEHSPMYHVFMTNYMALLLESGFLEQSQNLIDMTKIAVDAAQWFVMPDGMLLPFGDTPRILAAERAHFPIGTNQQGEPGASGVRWFKSGGLVVQHVSSNAGQSNSYLAFNGAFHSRQHKQADDFNFLLHANGMAIFDDPGTFTYQYDDPRRMYVESTRAHSCLEIDGLNTSRYNNEAYGSAIRHVQEVGPMLFIEANLHRKRLISPDLPNNAITTADGVPVDVRHSRKLIHLPGEFLLVVDDVKSTNEHVFKQHFNLNHKLLIKLGNKAMVMHGKSLIATIEPLTSSMSAVELAYGQKVPKLHGWASLDGHTLVSSPTLSVKASGSKRVMATFINLKPSRKTKVFFNEGTGGKYLRLVIKRDGKTHEFLYRDSNDRRTLTFAAGDEMWEATV